MHAFTPNLKELRVKPSIEIEQTTHKKEDKVPTLDNELLLYLKYEDTLLTPSRADQVSQAVVRKKTKQSYSYNR